MKLGVVGAGHVGLVVATGVAELGHEVVAVDLPDRVEALRAGEIGFFEPGLPELVAEHTRRGSLTFTPELARVADAEVTWIAVRSPRRPDGEIVIDEVEAAVADVAEIARTEMAIALKTTMPLGGCARAAVRIADGRCSLVYNPEFLRQGSAVADFATNKIVVGTPDARAGDVVLKALEGLDAELVIRCDWTSAELLKLAQNSFNALRISFLNELAHLAEVSGASIETVSRGLRDDPALLGRYMRPGFSYGGSCLPLDVEALRNFAASEGVAALMLGATVETNELVTERAAERLLERDGPIALWGLCYKDGTDDLSNSPAVELARRLKAAGREVRVFEPLLEPEKVVALGFSACASAIESLEGAAALVVTTPREAFLSVPAHEILNHVPSEAILDPAGALPVIAGQRQV